MRRTVVAKLDVDDSDAILLHETVKEYLLACNYAVRSRCQYSSVAVSKLSMNNSRSSKALYLRTAHFSI